MASTLTQRTGPMGLSRDFWLFWTGQVISALGSSITSTALPLLVYSITGSALDLGIAGALNILPYLIFGLFIGAWVDRLDRKKIMIITDIGRAVVIGLIPVLALFNVLEVWMIYVLIFLHTFLRIWFEGGQFAIIPNLVSKDKLVAANGYIQASFSTASTIGPFIGGVILLVIPVQLFLFVDAASFIVSAVTLAGIVTRFKLDHPPERKHILAEIKEGLRYVFAHPVLRNIAIMMMLVNFFGASREPQIVTLAAQQFHATDTQILWLASAANIGIIVLSLSAGFLRKRFSFTILALGMLMISGVLTFSLSFITSYWLALPVWGLIAGSLILFNINNGALRQAIVPSHLLGRVVSVAFVTAWSCMPIGSLAGGFLIEKTGNVALIYMIIGIVFFIVPCFFFFTALGKADSYIEQSKKEAEQAERAKELEQAKAEAQAMEKLEVGSEFPAEAGAAEGAIEGA